MVDSGKPSGKMVRLFVGGGNGDAETNVLGRRRHGWHHGERLVHWPLSAADDSRVQRILVNIITTYFIAVVSVLFACVQSQGLEKGACYSPKTSAMKMPWNLASSSNLASSTQWSRSLNFQDSSSGCRQSPGDWCPLPEIQQKH